MKTRGQRIDDLERYAEQISKFIDNSAEDRDAYLRLVDTLLRILNEIER